MFSPSRPGGGGDCHMKVTGMLVVSLMVVNWRFWSHLGCSGQKAKLLPIQLSFRVVRKGIYTLKNKKSLLYEERATHFSLFVGHTSHKNSSYLVVCFSMVSCRSQTKPEPRPDWSPFIWESPLPG